MGEKRTDFCFQFISLMSEKIPNEVFATIFSYCPISDFRNIMISCHRFCDIVSSYLMEEKWRKEMKSKNYLRVHLVKRNHLMAFTEFFFNKEGFASYISHFRDDAKKVLLQEWEEAQLIPWFTRMKLMHSPEHLVNQLKKGRYLPSFCVERICRKVKEIVFEEPNVISAQSPITIVGNICGHFESLLRIFELKGMPDKTRYLFLGDYVNRGQFSVESSTLLFLLKTLYPNNIILLRGRHESEQISSVYGFSDECQSKYDRPLEFNLIMKTFYHLPIAAIVNNEIFCVHGGLSPHVRAVEQLFTIKRNREIPHDGPFCDIIWSDPEDIETWQIQPRGASWLYGHEVSKQWNKVNKFKFMVRSHQLVQEGINWKHDGGVCTVWSCANYCGRCGNDGAVLNIDEKGEYNTTLFSEPPPLVFGEEVKATPQYLL